MRGLPFKKLFTISGCLLFGSLHGGVDLAVTAVNFSSSRVKPGDTVPVSVTLNNIGDADLAGSVVVRLSSTLVNATAIDQTYVAGLAAGSSAIVDFDVVIGDADVNATYPISITVDPANAVVEDDETNNGPTSFGAIIVEAFPNLGVSNIDLGSGPFYPGDTLAVNFDYDNTGDRSADTSFTITANLVVPATGLSSTNSITIPAGFISGGVANATINLPIRLNNPNGAYEVEVLIDALGTVDEGDNEGDNNGLATFTIDTQPDLEIVDLGFETGTWEAGDIIDMNLTFHNASSFGSAGTVRVDNDASGDYQIEVVLSTDLVFGNDDDFLLYLTKVRGNPETGGALLPNNQGVLVQEAIDGVPGQGNDQFIELVWQQAMPGNLYGDYFVLAKIDTQEAITEYVEVDSSDNGNNVWYPRETAKISLTPSASPQAVTSRVSINEAGEEGSGLSEKPALSEDGRYVAFSSLSQLVPEDTDDYFDIYLRDNLSGKVSLVSGSLAVSGFQDGDSQYPDISADGRFVVFQSASANLVGGDTNGHVDIFVADMSTGVIHLVSRDFNGGFANGNSTLPSLSDDGNTVVFQSNATDLVAGGTSSGRLHVYAVDLSTQTTTLVSVASGGGEADANSFEAKVSGDAAFAVFTSEAANLVGGVTGQQIYRADLSSGAIMLVSEDGAGVEGNADSYNPSINEDGSVVAYATEATNLGVGAPWVSTGLSEIIVADIAGAVVTPERLLTSDGAQFDNVQTETPVMAGALNPVLSADGSRVLFRTQSSNILPTTKVRSDGDVWDESIDGGAVGYSDLNSYSLRRSAVSDLYLYDRSTTTYEIASLNTFGYQGALLNLSIGDGDSLPALPSSRDGALSADGRYVAFSSDGRGSAGFDHGRTNRLSRDENEVRDVFIRDLRTGAEPNTGTPMNVSLAISPLPLTEGQPALVSVTTDDPTRKLESVQLIVDRTAVESFDRGSYVHLWTPDSAGIYELYAIVVDADGFVFVSPTQSITVSETNAPVVFFDSPVSGEELVAGQATNLIAWATDDGSVASIEFFVDGVSVGLDTEAPYRMTWTPTATGTLQLVAVATDNTGARGYSQMQAITVVNVSAPTATLVSPDVTDLDANGVADAPLTRGATTRFGVRASDADGVIATVDFLVNGISVGAGAELTEFGLYELDYVPPLIGTFTLDAVVRDNDGFGRTVSLDYTVVSGSAPTVNFVNPFVGSVDIDLQKTLELKASITDPENDISAVAFYVDGVPLLTQNTVGSEYVATYTPDFTGMVTWTIEVFDVEGNRVLQSLDLNVVAGSAPTVEILSPPVGGRYLPGTDLSLWASAFDADGVVDRVEYYLNGQLINTVGSPFLTSLSLAAVPSTIVPEPSYTLTAVAVDDQGNRSAPQTVDFKVGPLDLSTPRVVVSHPLPLGNGDVINDASVASETWINAEVFDPDSSMDDITVEFYANGQLLDTVTEYIGNNFATFLDFSALGNYSLYARAIDNNGTPADPTDDLIGQAVPILLDILQLQAPMPTIEVLPISGERPAEQPIPLYAETDGGLVSITRVDFFVNGVIIDSVTTPLVENGTKSIYTLNWTPDTDILNGLTTRDVEITARAVQVEPNGLPADNWRISAPTRLTLGEPLFNAPTTSVEISNPLDGAVYNQGSLIPLIADVATSGAGASLKVDFYANGEVIGTVTNAPFRIYWSPGVPGNYAISAVLEETGNAILASSVPIAVTVDPGTGAPLFSYVGPTRFTDPTAAPGAYPTVTAGSDVQLEADVSDSDGTISEVRFFIDGVDLGTDDTYPFNVFWKPRTEGTYLIEAEAIDNSGKIRLYSQDFQALADRSLTVSQPTGQVPSLSLSLTANGNVSPGSRLIALANVFDDGPGDVDVTFFMNGQQIGDPQSAPPYYVVIDPIEGVVPNVYSITGLATDTDGNGRAVTVSPLYISDVATEQPAVTIVTPTSGANLTAGSRASLRASVVGAAASNVAKVLFYANGVQIGEALAEPFTVDWIPTMSGTAEITAAVLQNTNEYDHDDDFQTPLINVTPVTVSNHVPVTVNALTGDLPSVSFQVLPKTTDLAQGSQVIFYADAQDYGANAGISEVEFFVNGISEGVISAAPYALVWTAEQSGSFLVNAVATDLNANVVSSNFIGVTVSSTVVSKTPAINLTLPTSAVRSGDLITLRSSVSDFVVGPEAVAFYVDGQEVGSVDTKPYNFVWEANLDGNVSVFATARQTLGNGSILTAASLADTITLLADQDPVVSVEATFPGEGPGKPNPLLNEPITFTITATDNGVVEQVELVRNSVTIATLTGGTAILTVTDTPPAVGLYDYSVVATDNAGRQTQSAVVSLNVGIGNVPTVAITSPAGGSSYLPGESITIRADASDTDGSISNVQFFVNGVPEGAPDTAPPYAVVFTPGISGSYELSARAEDNSGNFTLSSPTIVQVVSDAAPTINFDISTGNTLGTGTFADPYIVRVNQGFSITTEADDDNGLLSVTLTRNSATVAAPGGAQIPSLFFDTLTAPGVYGYQAEVQDTGSNVLTSPRLYVRAITGAKPTVAFETPQPGADVEVGQSTAIRVSAVAGAEANNFPVGSIAQVEFFANGTSFAVKTAPPYVAGYLAEFEGVIELSVIATSDTGVNSDEVTLTVNGTDSSLPSILNFTNDTTGNESFFNVPITFMVEATDEVGIRRVELYIDTSSVDGADMFLGQVTSEPYSFTYKPLPLTDGEVDDEKLLAGSYNFYARVVNASGASALSDPVMINILHPRPLEKIEDYVFQSYIDILLRIPEGQALTADLGRFDSNLLPVEQTAAASQILSLLADAGFVPVRSTLLAYYLLGRKDISAGSGSPVAKEWPTRSELEAGARLVSQAGAVDFGELDNAERANAVSVIVELLLPTFQETYGQPLPVAASPAAEIDAFISNLWLRKYAQPISSQNLTTARSRFRALGRETFIAYFILDVGNISTPSGAVITPTLGFKSPPNDNFLAWSDSAMLLSLLRSSAEEYPLHTADGGAEGGTLDVVGLSALLPAERVYQILDNPAYAARFEVADIQLIHSTDDWKQSSWFGWFYDDPATGWNWHPEMGWVWYEMENQKENRLWYYDRSMGWLWTSATSNPFVYSATTKNWFYRYPLDLSESEGLRWFFDMQSLQWISN